MYPHCNLITRTAVDLQLSTESSFEIIDSISTSKVAMIWSALVELTEIAITPPAYDPRNELEIEIQ